MSPSSPGTPASGRSPRPACSRERSPVVSTIGTSGGGLPVCYDPLWRAITDLPPPIYNVGFPSGVFAAGVSVEARFGAGVIGSESNLRSDTGTPSAHGLQRISNFVPYVSTNAFLRSATGNWPFTYLRSGSSYPSTLRDLAAETFVSPDDIVMQNSEANATILNNPNGTGTAGSIVPEFFNVTIGGVSTTEIRTDYRYTWFFTGRQVDTTNGSVFEGDIVVCDGRPFGLDPVLYPITGGTPSVASGETTIEGIFGYSTNLQDVDTNGHGYGAAADRTVLLRWPALSTDPEVRVGGWIADVTYERFQNLSDTRANTYVGTGASYPMQRCHWYQVIKKGDIETETIGGNTYRRMIVYTNTPIRSRTLLGSGGAPVYVNAALVMPTVVNVFSKTFYTR